MGLSARSAYPHGIAGLIRPSPSSCLPAFSVGLINATSLRRFERPPQPTGPLLRGGYVVSLILAHTTRSASLDDSCRLPSVAGYTASLCPTIWSGLSPRPSPLWVNTPSLRAIIPTPGGEVVTPQLVTTSKAFRNRVRRQLLHSPDTCFCRVNLTTLQCSLHATARRLASPPVQVRPGVPQPTRTFTPELSRGGSPEPRVGYDYTTPLGRDCDRTFTGWSAAVMGCALCWLIQKRSTNGLGDVCRSSQETSLCLG